MRWTRLATMAFLATLIGPGGAGAQAPKADEKGRAAQQEVAPLAARDVIERLKTIRSEIVLEEEYIRLLKTKLERAEVEAKIAALEQPRSGGSQAAAPTPRSVSPVFARPPPARTDDSQSLVVKAVTTHPFKEAIVTYRGRAYTVRPGDRLGDIEIRDVTDSGVVTGSSDGSRPVLLGR